ncbi:MAG: TlpA family protein disulfide reductase [Bacteroidia bacterium]|nr:TlpA family protein disulfide reductase [Bacteroidia bacterium]
MLTIKKYSAFKWVFIGLLTGYFVYHFYYTYVYFPNLTPSDFSLKTMNNNTVSTDTLLSNKNTIIIFFQTWCGPCIQEMRLLNKHKNDFYFTNMYFITDESHEKVRRTISKFQLDSSHILLSEKSFKEMGISAFPTSYFFKNGLCIEKQKGSWIDMSNYEDALFHVRKMFQN